MAQENIDVTVRLADHLSRPAREAAREVDKLGNQVDELAGSMTAAGAAAEFLQHGVSEVGQESRSAGRHVRSADTATKGYTARLVLARAAALGHAAASDLSSAATRAVESASNGAGRALASLGSAFAKAGEKGKGLASAISLLKIPAIITGITLLAQGVSALGAAGIAGVAGLSPLVGTLGAMPVLVGGLLQAFGAVKLGMSGIGAAVKVLSDPAATADKISAALKLLNPAQRTFAIQVAKTKEQTKGWGKAIATAMLPGFGKGLKEVAKQFPVIKKGLVDTGSAMGDLGAKVGKTFGSWTDLDDIMARNNRMIQFGLSPALVGMLRILHDIIIAAGPMAERFAKWVGRAVTNLADLTDAGTKSGKLEGFFNRAGDLAKKVVRFIDDIAVGLFNIGKQSGSLNKFEGHGLLRLADAFRKWTESAKGKNQIRQYFKDTLPVIRQLSLLIGSVFKLFGGLAGQKNLAPLIKQLRTELVPALANLSGQVSAKLGPALIDLATGFVNFESALSYNPFIAVVGFLGKMLLGVSKLIAKVPFLGTILATLITAKMLWSLGSMASKMSGLTWAVKKLAANEIIATNAEFAMAGAMDVLLGPVGLIILAVIALVGLFILLYKHNKRFHDLVNKVAKAIVSFGKQAWQWIKKVGEAVGKFLIAAWKKIWPVVKWVWDAIMKVVGVVIHAVMAYFKVWWFVVKNYLEFMIGLALLTFKGIVWVVKWAIGMIKKWFVLLWHFIRPLVRLIGTEFKTVWHAIVTAAKWLWKQLSAGFQRLKNFLTPIWNGIKKVIKAVIDWIMPYIRPVLSAIHTAFKKVGDFLGGIWDGLTSGLSKALSWAIGMINTLIDGINKLIDGINEVKVGSDIAHVSHIGAPSTAAPGAPGGRTLGGTGAATPEHHFAGGVPTIGALSLVGELGPELFVSKAGGLSGIGLGGPETRRFAEPGFIIPAAGTPQSVAEMVPDWVVDRLEAPVSVGAPGGGGGPAWDTLPDLHLHIEGGTSLTTPELERAMIAAWKRYDRERRERR